MKHELKLIRVYDLPEKDEEYRILVDGLWPRGVSKRKIQMDRWAKEVAPAPDLRIWFDYAAERYELFSKAYIRQLDNSLAAQQFVSDVKEEIEHRDVWLLFAEKDPMYNHVVILADWLMNHLRDE